jgi:hypothetical protein
MVNSKTAGESSKEAANEKGSSSAPSISLPKGGGAIRGIGEKFAANPITGTGSMTVPIYTSPGRSGFDPQLAVSYDSGAGNGPFGFGWQLSLPSITRKTDRGLPKYDDGAESDVFVLSGAEDLVPVLEETPTGWKRPDPLRRMMNGVEYTVRRYRPRIEALFARIERWTEHTNAAHTFWRSISKDNITTWYGKTEESRVADPHDAARIFQWLICETHDDKGNVIAYGYKKENSDSVDVTRAQKFGDDAAALFAVAGSLTTGGGKIGPGRGLEPAPASGRLPGRAVAPILVAIRPPALLAESKRAEDSEKGAQGTKAPEPAPEKTDNGSSAESPSKEKLFTPAEPRSSEVPPQLGPGGKTTLTREQVQRLRGTPKERGDAAKEHQAELSRGTGKEKASQTAKGPRLHDVRDEPTSTYTIFRREVKNYLKWITLPSREVVQNKVTASVKIVGQIHKDKLWLREGKKLGESRVVQWDFVGAGPDAELADILNRSGIPYTQ